MSMSKKDFIALADELRPALTPEHVSASGKVTLGPAPIIDALCRFMRGQNPNFKEDRWRDYLAGNCGPGGGAVKVKAEEKTPEECDECADRDRFISAVNVDGERRACCTACCDELKQAGHDVAPWVTPKPKARRAV
jgi:hypothetical protein